VGVSCFAMIGDRIALRKAANHIKRIEIYKIVGSGGEVIECELVGDRICNAYGIINLALLEVQEDHIRISPDPENDKEGFEVTYYDMPFMDHSRLGEFTYFVLLSSTDTKNRKAKIKIVILPKHYYSSENNLRFDAMIGDLLEKAGL